MSNSKLDSNQVLPLVLDESTKRLRVDAQVSASVSDVNVVIDSAGGDNIAIVNSGSGNELAIESDGSLNANVTLTAADDSVSISDGTDTLAINADGSINIDKTNLATSALQTTGNTTLSSILTELQLKADLSETQPVSVQNIPAVKTDDLLVVSETFSTTSGTNVNARPINGNINLRNYKTKNIFVQNTSINNGRLTLTGSVDDGANYDVVLVNGININAGVTNVTTTESPITHLRIDVRSATPGLTTTYTTKAYATGV